MRAWSALSELLALGGDYRSLQSGLSARLPVALLSARLPVALLEEVMDL
jgi:hypothetical protein